jgi:hypothetical protein
MRDHDRKTLQSILEARGRFGHREHLELAWNYLQSYEAEEANRTMARAIRHLASRHGDPHKYHETITRFWVQLVALHRAKSGAQSFDQFIAENEELLDSHLLARHYSQEQIGSSHARIRWTEPDLRELPRVI